MTARRTADNVRLVMMGVCGSGKSAVGRRVAQRWSVPFVEGDELHPARNVERMAAGVPLTDDDRWEWLDAVGEQLRRAQAASSGLVVSCSALKRAYRDRLRSHAPDVKFVHLHGAHELLEARLRGRAGHYMPASLLDSQLAILNPLDAEEAGCTLDIAHTPEQLVDEVSHYLEVLAA